MLQRIFILKGCPIFSELPGSTLAKIAPFLEERHVPAGTVLIQQGEVNQSLYIVVDGQVRLHKDDEEEAVLGKKEVFGEFALLSTETCSTTATTLEETTLLILEQDLLYELMSAHTDIARGIIQVLSQRL